METRFDITVRHRGPVVVVHPRGRLTVHSATALHEILANKLRNHGQVVVDLDGFALDHAAAVDIFPAVMTECGGWPVAKLVLCRPDPQMAQVLTTRPDQAPAVFPTSAAQHCCPGTGCLDSRGILCADFLISLDHRGFLPVYCDLLGHDQPLLLVPPRRPSTPSIADK